MRLARLACSVMLAACGSPSASAPPPETPAQRAPEATADPSATPARSAPARSVRSLAPDATFEDLASAARTLDDRRDQESDAACLLAASERGFELRADLAVAVRPLPAPDEDLDARLANERGPVRVLTRYGAYGTAPAQLGLVAATTALPPQRGVALALFLTNEGVYARRTDQPGGERNASRIEWMIEHTEWSSVDLVAVTAESGVPLASLVELLRRLPAALSGRVTLAVPLAEGTRLPDTMPAVEAGERAELCPEGLPEVAEDEPLGDLSPAAIRAALGPLQSRAELCVGTSTGPGAAGGRVVLAVRIAADGRVRDACAMEDATGDPALRACLANAARQLAFDPPGGTVDFALPLVLEAGRAQRQTPICE